MDIKGLGRRPGAFGGRFDAVYFDAGEAPALGFCDVMLTGLARDGGLYVPETWPQFAPETIAGFSAGPIGKSRSR